MLCLPYINFSKSDSREVSTHVCGQTFCMSSIIKYVHLEKFLCFLIHLRYSIERLSYFCVSFINADFVLIQEHGQRTKPSTTSGIVAIDRL